jgi:hypothetical protein
MKLGAKPYFEEFEISECVENCQDPAKLFTQAYKDNSLKMNFAIWLNCADRKADIRINSDTLFLDFRSNDSISYACLCYFNVNLTIKNLKTNPKTILFNHHKLEENSVNFIN